MLLTALPIIAVIASVSAVLAINYRNAAVRTKLDEIATVARADATSIRRFVGDQLATLEALSLAAPVGTSAAATQAWMRRIQRNVRFATPAILYFLDSRGRVVSTDPGEKAISLARRAYVRAALRGRQATSEVLIRRQDGEPALMFAVPVATNAGGRAGVIASSVELREVAKALDPLPYTTATTDYVVDRDRNLILGAGRIGELTRPPAGIEPSRRPTGPVSELQGHRRIVGRAPVEGTGWMTAVSVPYGDLIGPLDRRLVLELTALGVLTLLGIGVVVLVGGRVARWESAREDALEEQRRIAGQLQNSMLPRLPAPAGLELEARYAPAQRELAVGGDWYDVVDVGAGKVAASIGDVSGHGLHSASVMGQLRSSIRTLSLSGHSPAAALTQLDTFTAVVDGQPLATVVQTAIDTRTGDVRYACAGHPEPVIVRASGSAEVLSDGRSPLLGLASSEPRAEGTARLAQGDTLLIYTDGLIEHPGSSLEDGMAALRRVATRIGPDPRRLARELLDTVPEPRRDDVAILCIRFTGAPHDEAAGARPQSSALS